MTTHRARVLIVDNEPVQLDVLDSLLATEHDVLVARTGEEALLCANEQIPDLILLDVMMPGMGGHEVCRRLKADPRTSHIPVIFLTGKVAVEDEVAGLALGAADYLRKPESPPIVKARVRTQLELKRRRDELARLAEEKERFLSVAAHDVAAAGSRRPASNLLIALSRSQNYRFRATGPVVAHPTATNTLRDETRTMGALRRGSNS